MLLEKLQASYPLKGLSLDLLIEIQQCLKAGNYYDVADGAITDSFKAAFFQFKKDVWLEEPEILGPTTARALVELKNKHQASKESSKAPTGELSGASMRLPDGRLVYEDQFMIDGVPLTWGETTKGCSRVPCENWELQNAIKLAQTFGEVRDKFGSPLIITSGYRPVAINRAVGGASNSQHIYFKALDIQPANGDFSKLWQILKSSKFTGLGDGVSSGKGFYHADIRDGGRIIFGY